MPEAPVRKVTAGLLAGALTVILVWVASLAGLEVPPPVAAAVTTLLTFVTSYMVPAE
jgi:putative flippase GtrA